jgi:hypothetical protein
MQSGLVETGICISTLRSVLSIVSSLLYCDLVAEHRQHRTLADGLQQVGVGERDVERDHELEPAGLVARQHLDALGPEVVQRRRL